jgi:hypothetical protein
VYIMVRKSMANNQLASTGLPLHFVHIRSSERPREPSVLDSVQLFEETRRLANEIGDFVVDKEKKGFLGTKGRKYSSFKVEVETDLERAQKYFASVTEKARIGKMHGDTLGSGLRGNKREARAWLMEATDQLVHATIYLSDEFSDTEFDLNVAQVEGKRYANVDLTLARSKKVNRGIVKILEQHGIKVVEDVLDVRASDGSPGVRNLKAGAHSYNSQDAQALDMLFRRQDN